ncbi:T9SS type A sorting domain-containing protein [Candidatus Margulisiibacteriota bacterium]
MKTRFIDLIEYALLIIAILVVCVTNNYCMEHNNNSTNTIFNRILENGEYGHFSYKWNVKDGFLSGGLEKIKKENETENKETDNYVKYNLNNIFFNNKTSLVYKLSKKYRDFTPFQQLVFWLKSDISDPALSLQIGLLDRDNETWLTPTANIITESFSLYGINLKENELCLSSDNKNGNNKLDLEEIKEIKIIITSKDEERKNQAIYLDNLKLMIKKVYSFDVIKQVQDNKKTAFQTASLKKLSTDQTKPVLEFVKCDSKEIQNGDFIEPGPNITAKFTDNAPGDTGITSVSFRLIKEDNTITQIQTSQPAAATSSYTVNTSPSSALPAGEHTLEVSAADAAGNRTTKNIAVVINDKLNIKNTNNGPNPFNPNNEVTNIQYQLSQDANVKIYIYSISGKHIWTNNISAEATGGTTGFNTISWDGKNRFGEIVANGMYITYIIAEKGAEKAKAKVKIAVLK